MLDANTAFANWIQDRDLHCIGTNAGSKELPFQSWQHFKEAFAPELLQRAVTESRIRVTTCLDPFGGSGTSALACQFLGIDPTTIEVNPYLADLIEAKLCHYNADLLNRDFGRLLATSRTTQITKSRFLSLPPTFIEPGVNDRWIFNSDVADEIFRLRSAIEQLTDQSHQRFFRIQLGGILTAVSNIRVSGKGRRYRSNWKERTVSRHTVRNLFSESAQKSILEVHQFSRRPSKRYKVIRGDARTQISKAKKADLIVFSPPYPNSFDYTDVYNVELWTLGYLNNFDQNRELRNETLSSHVQIKRAFAAAPSSSRKLNGTLRRLRAKRDELWSSHIPEMVAAYFAELNALMTEMQTCLSDQGSIWIVVGDSQYAGVRIDVPGILQELASKNGFATRTKEPFRSMRSSPQQGGQQELPETLLVLDKN